MLQRLSHFHPIVWILLYQITDEIDRLRGKILRINERGRVDVFYFVESLLSANMIEWSPSREQLI